MVAVTLRVTSPRCLTTRLWAHHAERDGYRGSMKSRMLIKRLALSAGALVAVSLALEAAARFYYWFGGAPLAIPYNAPDAAWKAEWVARHVRTNIDVTYGYDQYDERLGWSLRPNLRELRCDGQPAVTTNSRGLRDSREIPYAKRPGTRRIVVLGDSFTFGQNVEQDQAWPACLQQSLPGWEVLNLAVHGYGTDQQCLMLQAEGTKYQPDIVVLGFFVENAFRNVLAFRDYAKPLYVLRDGDLELTNVPVPRPSEIMADARSEVPLSYAWHFLRRRWMGRYGSASFDTPSTAENALRVTRALLREIHRSSEKVHARLLVVVIPYDEFSPSRMVEEAVAECGRGDQFPVLNLRGPLRQAEADTGTPMYDAHFTAAGHEATAEAVRGELLHLGWIE
jgi:hypothetical protein